MEKLEHVIQCYVEANDENYLTEILIPAVVNKQVYCLPNRENIYYDLSADKVDKDVLDTIVKQERRVNMLRHLEFIGRELNRFYEINNKIFDITGFDLPNIDG